MAAQHGLDIDSFAGVDWVELSDDLASSDDGEVFAAVFHCVEDVGKVPGCVGGAHLRHAIRLSDRGTANARALILMMLWPGHSSDPCRREIGRWAIAVDPIPSWCQR